MVRLHNTRRKPSEVTVVPFLFCAAAVLQDVISWFWFIFLTLPFCMVVLLFLLLLGVLVWTILMELGLCFFGVSLSAVLWVFIIALAFVFFYGAA